MTKQEKDLLIKTLEAKMQNAKQGFANAGDSHILNTVEFQKKDERSLANSNTHLNPNFDAFQARQLAIYELAESLGLQNKIA